MLFLAVTLGFFVENWREHIIEDKRASELARSLYYELQNDSVNLEKAQKYRLDKENSLIALIAFIRDSNLNNTSSKFCHCMVEGLVSFARSQFDPRDAILDQLKSSGMLRYFKDPLFQKGLTELSFAITAVRIRNERERTYFNQHINPFTQKHVDHNWIGLMLNGREITVDSALILDKDKGRTLPCRLINAAGVNKEEVANMLKYYQHLIIRHTRLTAYHNYLNLNHDMQMLLRRKFNLD
jgi:hypothetical protein